MNQRNFTLPDETLAAAKLKVAPTPASEKNGVLNDVSTATYDAITRGLIEGRSFPDLLKEKMEQCTSPKELHDLRVLHEAVLVVAQEWRKGNNVSTNKIIAQANTFDLNLGKSVFLFVREVSKHRRHEHSSEISQLESVRVCAEEQEALVKERSNQPAAKEVRKQKNTERGVMLETDLGVLLTEVSDLLLADAKKQWRANTSKWKFWARFPEKQECAKIAQELQSWLRDDRKGKKVTNTLLAEEVFALRSQKHALLGLAAPTKTPYVHDELDDLKLADGPNEAEALDPFIDDFELQGDTTTNASEPAAPALEPVAAEAIVEPDVAEDSSFDIPHLEIEEVVHTTDAPVEIVDIPHLEVTEIEQVTEPVIAQEIALETPAHVEPLEAFLSNTTPATEGTRHVTNFETGPDVQIEPIRNQEVRRTNLDGTTKRVPTRTEGSKDYSWASPRRAARDASDALVASLALDGKVLRETDAYFTAAMQSEDGIASAPVTEPIVEPVVVEKEIMQEPEPIEYAIPYSGSVELAHNAEGAVTMETTLPVITDEDVVQMNTAEMRSETPSVIEEAATESPLPAAVETIVQPLSLPFSEELLQSDTLQTLLKEGRPLEVEMIVDNGQTAVLVQIQEYNMQSNHVIMDVPGHGLIAKDLVALRRLNEPPKEYPLAVVPAATPVATVNDHTMRVGMTIRDTIRSPMTLPQKLQEPLRLGYDKAPAPTGIYEEFGVPSAFAEAEVPAKAEPVVVEAIAEPAKPKKPPMDFKAAGLPSSDGVLKRSNIFEASDGLFTPSELSLLIGKLGQYIDGTIDGKKARLQVQGVDPEGNIKLLCTFVNGSAPGVRTIGINELRLENGLKAIELEGITVHTRQRVGMQSRVPFNAEAFLSTLMTELGNNHGSVAQEGFEGAAMGSLKQEVHRMTREATSLEDLKGELEAATSQHDEEFSEGFAYAWKAGLESAQQVDRTIEPLVPTKKKPRTPAARRLKWVGKLLSLVGF